MHRSLIPLAMALVLVAAPAAAQTTTELTDAEAAALAVQGSPTLRAALLELRASQQAVRSAELERVPVFRASVDGGHGETLSATMEGVTPNADDRVSTGVGVSWASTFGTEISADLAASWRARDVNDDLSEARTLSLGSSYGADAALRVTQPLLRGAGRDVGEAAVRSARLSRTAAEHARDGEASEVLRDVLEAYWELWYAEEAVAVQLAGLDLAERQLAEAEARSMDLGTMAPADALRFASELASIEERLAEAEEDRRARAIELGRLLGMAPGAALAIEAAEGMPDADFALSVEDAMSLARQLSSELLELEAQAESTRERITLAEDAALPRLDLTGSLTVSGLWNDNTLGSGQLPMDRPAVTGMVGLSLELPFVASGARAEVSEARLRYEAAEARLEARSQQIEAQAASLLDRLGTIERRVGLSERTVDVATRLAEAERQRFDLGMGTSLQVLEAQESQRETELRHRRALVDQAKTAIDLNHLTGQLLEHYAALFASL